MDHGSHGMDMDMGGGDGACKISMLWNWYSVDACFLSSSWHVKSKAQFAGSVIGICLLVMAIEGVRRLGREYDRRLLRARNDAVENATCGMGVGAGLPAASGATAGFTAPALTKVESIMPIVESNGGGCGSKSGGGGCGSKNIVPANSTGGCGTGGGCGSSTPSKELYTPSAELGSFNANTTNSPAGGFSQMHCRPPIPSLPTWSQQIVRSFIYGSQFSAAFLVMLLGMYFNGFVLIAIFIGATLGYLVFGSDTVSAPEAPSKNESPCCC